MCALYVGFLTLFATRAWSITLCGIFIVICHKRPPPELHFFSLQIQTKNVCAASTFEWCMQANYWTRGLTFPFLLSMYQTFVGHVFHFCWYLIGQKKLSSL